MRILRSKAERGFKFCGKCGTKVIKMPEELKWEEEDTVTFDKKQK